MSRIPSAFYIFSPLIISTLLDAWLNQPCGLMSMPLVAGRAIELHEGPGIGTQHVKAVAWTFSDPSPDRVSVHDDEAIAPPLGSKTAPSSVIAKNVLFSDPFVVLPSSGRHRSE